MQRHRKAVEIAAAALWLVSDGNSFTTGAIGPVDGDESARVAEEARVRLGKGEDERRRDQGSLRVATPNREKSTSVFST